jgi:hypothetical protein
MRSVSLLLRGGLRPIGPSIECTIKRSLTGFPDAQRIKGKRLTPFDLDCQNPSEYTLPNGGTWKCVSY